MAVTTLIHPQLAALDGLEYQQGGHDLGGAGDGQLVVGVLVIEYGARLGLHQQGAALARMSGSSSAAAGTVKRPHSRAASKKQRANGVFSCDFSPCML